MEQELVFHFQMNYEFSGFSPNLNVMMMAVPLEVHRSDN